MGYLTVKALHIMSVIAWMAGMFYLPRLYVYHSGAKVDSELDKTFRVMERKLLRFIINPAMIATFVFGIWLVYIIGFSNLGKWFHIKIVMLIALTSCHGLYSYHRRQFAVGHNKYSHRYYRWVNEIPTICMVVIVYFAVAKPF